MNILKISKDRGGAVAVTLGKHVSHVVADWSSSVKMSSRLDSTPMLAPSKLTTRHSLTGSPVPGQARVVMARRNATPTFQSSYFKSFVLKTYFIQGEALSFDRKNSKFRNFVC